MVGEDSRCPSGARGIDTIPVRRLQGGVTMYRVYLRGHTTNIVLSYDVWTDDTPTILEDPRASEKVKNWRPARPSPLSPTPKPREEHNVCRAPSSSYAAYQP